MQYYNIKTYIDSLGDLLISHNIKNLDSSIENLTFNSKLCTKNTLFVCKGASFKEEYLQNAIDLGASIYISEKKYDVNAEYILVSDIRKSMPFLSNVYFERPHDKLNLIGITGTKGKSTTAYYIKSILDDYLKSLNKKSSAILSSIDVYDGVINEESHITTPENIDLQQHFLNAINSNIEFLTMEVSSQALKYNRVDQINFGVSIFLNISEDHISPLEHGDFNDYFNSKLKIFSQSDIAIVSSDCDYSNYVLEASKSSKKTITFGVDYNSDVHSYDIKKVGDEIHFKVKTKDFTEDFILTMPGLFNVENALAAIATSLAYNIPMNFIKSGLKKARSSGRMELYSTSDKKIISIVDYAHNKLSFEKLFESTKKEYPEYNIISIFGCPGEKALLRRQHLPNIASKYSNKIYIVAEDPGLEDFYTISEEIAKYVTCDYEIIEDRGEAIEKSINNSFNKTIILITGKGNETRQKYGKEYLPCLSDVEYTKKFIQAYDEKLQKSL